MGSQSGDSSGTNEADDVEKRCLLVCILLTVLGQLSYTTQNHGPG